MKPHRLFAALLLALSLLQPGARAEEAEIYGFLVDHSISRIGHEFYRYFSERLRDTSPLDFNLVVKERPSARWGSLVWVEYEDRTIYRQFLMPNTSQIQAIAYAAADQVREAINRQRIENLLQDNFDMDGGEL